VDLTPPVRRLSSNLPRLPHGCRTRLLVGGKHGRCEIYWVNRRIRASLSGRPTVSLSILTLTVGVVSILCFSQKLDLGASASDAKSLFHWLRGRLMMLKRMLRIQFL